MTVYATVPVTFIRYLTKRYVEKDSPTLNHFNEMKHGRPEFYFFVSRKTFACINMTKKSLQRQPNNILFNCLFDHEVTYYILESGDKIYLATSRGGYTL